MLRGHKEENGETSRGSTSHCRRYDNRALPRFRTDGSKDLSHWYSHSWATDPANGRPGKILVDGLAKRGFSLGQNLIYEARGAAGNVGQIPNLMQELKAANVDVVATIGYPSAASAKASGVATVIASGSGDPVMTGLVQTLARPGGNVTGIADDAAALSTKRLGLLKAV